MEAKDDTGAFHYNAPMASVVSPHTNGLLTDPASQMMHQEYDSGQQVADEGSEIYSNAPKGNNQMQGDLYGLSSDQMYTGQNNFAPSTAETAEVYNQQQGDVQNNEEYAANDPNMEAYMMEHNQYGEYDPSQYPEEQYGNQFDGADQTENNQTISDVARTSTEAQH